MSAEMATTLDVQASWDTFGTKAGYTQFYAGTPMWKTTYDLDRYRKVIEATRPSVLVETGTCWGGFAAWVAGEFGVAVVTVDVSAPKRRLREWPRVTFVSGDSADPVTVERVAGLVDGRRCMVSLDSDHHAPHVVAEIEAYSPLVSPGCYLVVEDGLADLLDAERAIRFGRDIPAQGGPLRAIGQTVATWPGWRRDMELEAMTPVSHHPAGWWVRDVR